MAAPYDVFISHAGEDKAALAVFVYEGLKRRGIAAFLDQQELQVAGDAVQDMDHAMQTAMMGLFLLSPEFALKRYPMLELECFLRRAGLLGGENQESSEFPPRLIPVFYRLTVAQCKYASEFSNVVCNPKVHEIFNERVNRGETSVEKVLECLTLLARHTGVENNSEITNDNAKEMTERRKEFAESICDAVIHVLVSRSRSSEVRELKLRRVSESPKVPENVLHPTFDVPKNPEEVVLDFSSAFGAEEPRTHEAKVLREVLRDGEGTRIIGLVGAGGVGKSCILREVAGQEHVRRRFPGGVYFISLGVDASINTLRLELVRILRISGGAGVAAELKDEEWRLTLGRVKELLGRGRCLLILDDVWERNGLTPKIIAEVSRVISEGTVMFATRFTSIALRCHVVVQMEPCKPVSEMSRKILVSYSGFAEEEIEHDEIEPIILALMRVGGGLPLCLVVIGIGVRKLGMLLRGNRRHAWAVYLDKIRSCKDAFIRVVGDYMDLMTTISIALLVLKENEAVPVRVRDSWTELYRSLSVLKKHAVMPVSVLERMWKVRGRGEVWMILEGFASVGLGQLVYDEREGLEGLRIHDLCHDFAECFARDKGELGDWHARLLEGYNCSREEDGVRQWWRVSADGYIHENVCRHLIGSGAVNELIELLLKVEWTSMRYTVGGLPSWKRDFAECLEAIDSFWEDGDKQEIRRGLCLVRDAVAECWVYVRKNRRELGYHVFGRLGDAKEGVVRKYLKSVEQWHPKPWLRPTSRCLPRPGEVGKGEFLLHDTVWAIVLHSDPLFAVAGVGMEVVIVDLEEMRVVDRFVGHSDCVMKVWVSENGERARSWSCDETIRTWNIQTGEEVQVVSLQRGEHGGSDDEDFVNCATFSKDGSLLVTGSEFGNLKMWEVANGKKVGETMRGGDVRHLGDVQQRFDRRIWCIAMSPNGSRIVSGGRDGSLRVWNASTQTQEGATMTGHKDKIRCVVFSANGCRIASGSDDNTIRLWDTETKTQIGGPFCGHEHWIECLIFSSDDRFIVTSSDDGTVRVWDCASGTQLGRALQHSNWVNAVAMGTSGQFIVSGGGGGALRVWDLKATSDMTEKSCGHEGSVSCVSGSKDGCFIITGSSDKTVRIWDARTGSQVGDSLRGHTHPVSCVAVSPNGRRIVSGSLDNTLREWEVASLSQVGESMSRHTDKVLCVAYSSDGRLIVSGSEDGRALVWRAGTHEPIDVRALSSREVRFLLPGRFWQLLKFALAAVGAGLNASERDASMSESDLSMDEFDSSMDESNASSERRDTSVTESEDEALGNVNSDDRSFLLPRRLWYLAKAVVAAVMGSLNASSNNAWATLLYDSYIWRESASNDRLESDASVDETAFVHNSGVRSVVASPDSQRILCGLDDGTIWVWDIQSQRQVCNPKDRHEFCVEWLEISAQNEVISMDMGYHEVRWRLDRERGLIELSDDAIDAVRVASAHGADSSTAESSRCVVCRNQEVRLDGGDVVMATLPSPVLDQAWHFDSARDVLSVGMCDGRVLVFQVEK